MALSRRKPPLLPDLAILNWADIRGALYRYLRWVNDFYSSIPGGFLGSTPEDIQAGATASSGTESASWAAADHVHGVETAAPSNPTGTAPAEGTGTSLMRADATIQQGIVTTKGDLLGYSTVPERVPVGANGTVLMADSTQALGVRYSAMSVDDLELLAWIL